MSGLLLNALYDFLMTIKLSQEKNIALPFKNVFLKKDIKLLCNKLLKSETLPKQSSK